MNSSLDQRRFVVFSFLWCVATYFEQLVYSKWFPNWIGQINILFLIAAICKPRSIVIFFFLTLANAVKSFIWLSNETPNHTILDFWINVSLTVILFYFLFLRYIKKEKGDEGHAYAMLAPVLRLYLLIFCFFVIFSKLNHDFFNPAYSCADRMVKSLTSGYPGPIGWFFSLPGMITVTIWTTVAAEGLLAILLMFKPTRHYAIILGLMFFIPIGLLKEAPVFCFAILFQSLYFVFLSKAASDHFCRLAEKAAELFVFAVPYRVLRYFLIATVIYLPQFCNGMYVKDTFFSFWLWFIFYPLIGAAYLWAIWTSRGQADTEKNDLLPSPRIFLVLVLPLLFNGLGPYLGIKTQGGMTMYSNLRIFGQNSNHLIFPSALRLHDEELVKLLDSNKGAFRYHAVRPYLIAAHEFRRIANRDNSSFFVRCIYKGQEIVIYKGQDHPLLKPLPLFMQKFIAFKPVDERKHCYCQW